MMHMLLKSMNSEVVSLNMVILASFNARDKGKITETKDKWSGKNSET